MWPVYQRTARRDGYVSFEVSPYLAHNTEQTVAEARRLHELIARENVMIKVPGTPEGIPAIRQLIADGICVNVTLLFARKMYEAVARAYIEGLESLLQRGGDLSRVASVASFFVSRIDSAVDAQLASVLKAHSTDPAMQEKAKSVAGRVAIANAKLAYQDYKKIITDARWRKLADSGAQTQRLLWASTSTKNPSYRDVMYVEELIGPDTVNTVPPSTLEAFRDHGRVDATLENDVDEAREVLANLESMGISLGAVTDKLLQEAVTLFAEAFDKLINALEKRRSRGVKAMPSRFEFKLPSTLRTQVNSTLERWRTNGNMRRLWAGDAALWTNSDEANWLGWLRITEGQLPHLQRLTETARQISQAGFRQAVLLGMGGSSLTPEVFKLTFGRAQDFPEFHVLDSTDPQQIRNLEAKLDLGHTLFIVSSKSGTTLEPNILHQYFFDRLSQVVGPERAGEHFIAVTDPGSKVERTARSQNFRQVFPGVVSIGGRYSALSNFGLVPAAVMGVDVARLLDRTEEMVQACSATVAVEQNPGAVLGVILGTLARNGVDKVTVIASPSISDLGAWLEQLLAESTGKQGKALIPVDGEALGPPDVYGKDRLFVYVRLASAPDPSQDAAFAALENAGHPAVRITVAEPYDIGQEFFRWEIATAVAGAVMNLNPFNQPDVEASKVVTRELAAEYEKSGKLPSEAPLVSERGVHLFANGAPTSIAAGRSLSELLRAHLDQVQEGDYFAILAYLEMNNDNQKVLQDIRHTIRDRKRVATCLGFGPRFLHSTGQAYKGGPNTGVFLQITADDAVDLPVPGKKYTFGVIKAAQALGDLRVLTSRGRRVLRAHLPADVSAGLKVLQSAIAEAIGQLRTAA
jgi:transaldolase/glucose-6-phosphate isomerase